MTKHIIFLSAVLILIGGCQSEEQPDADTKAKVAALNALATEYGFAIDPGSESLRESLLDTMSLEEAKQMLLEMKSYADEVQKNNPEWVNE